MCYNKTMKKLETITHPFEPIFDRFSKVLVLGSMPSPKSREVGFYFGHPKNRFWKVLSKIFNEDVPSNNERRKEFLLKHNIALWDVVKSCKISGASDASIKSAKANDFNFILKQADIKAIFTLGKTATKLFKNLTNLDCIPLPSTSPANCAIPFDTLVEEFLILLKYLK